MFLRIASHTEIERLAWALNGRTVGKVAFVKAIHLLYEVRRVGMSARCRYESAILLGLVATKQKQVADAEELQVEQLIFDILDGRSAANHVGLHRDIITPLDSCCDSHRTRTATDALTLKLPVCQLFVHKLRVVSRDVDIGRIEFPQLVDIGKQFLCASPLQGRQNFKGKSPFGCILMDEFCNAHLNIYA